MRPIALVVPVLLLAACASDKPIVGRPKIPPGVPEEHLHFADAIVGRGDVAPDFALPLADRVGERRLSDFRGRPLVLVFGSHTCNVFARDVPALKQLYEETKSRVGFLMVYIREAHACDEWVMQDNVNKGLVIEQPQWMSARIEAAEGCVEDFGLEMPVVVDGIDDRVKDTYGGYPDRLYVIDANGRIEYQGGVGPFGFKPAEVREHLRERYGF